MITSDHVFGFIAIAAAVIDALFTLKVGPMRKEDLLP